MLIEITLTPIDIAKTYAEIRQLRKAVQEAELALWIRPHSPRRSRRSGRPNAGGSRPMRIRESASLASLGRRSHRPGGELTEKITTDQPDDIAGLKGESQQDDIEHDR